MRSKLSRRLSLKPSRSSGKSIFGGDGVSLEEAASSTAGMLSCSAWTSAVGGSVGTPWKGRGGYRTGFEIGSEEKGPKR